VATVRVVGAMDRSPRKVRLKSGPSTMRLSQASRTKPVLSKAEGNVCATQHERDARVYILAIHCNPRNSKEANFVPLETDKNRGFRRKAVGQASRIWMCESGAL